MTTTTYEYEFATIELTTFYCTLVDGDLRLTDHDATKWVTSTEAAHLAWAPADIPAVEAIASSHS